MVLSLPPGNLHTRSRERESEPSSGLSCSWVQTFGDLNLGMKFHVGCRWMKGYTELELLQEVVRDLHQMSSYHRGLLHCHPASAAGPQSLDP